MSNLEDSPDHVVAFFFTSEHREGACYINSFEVHGLVDVGSSRLAPSVLRAVAGGLRDPVERARVAGAAFAAES